MNKSKNMSTIRTRGSLFPRMIQRQSIGSRFDIEEVKTSSKSIKQSSSKNIQKNKQAKVQAYKRIMEQARSKSEMGFLSPNLQKQTGNIIKLKKCDSSWNKLISMKLGKYFQNNANLNLRLDKLTRDSTPQNGNVNIN